MPHLFAETLHNHEISQIGHTDYEGHFESILDTLHLNLPSSPSTSLSSLVMPCTRASPTTPTARRSDSEKWKTWQQDGGRSLLTMVIILSIICNMP